MKNKNVSILIDSGATHNFISQGLMKQLKLSTSNCDNFTVTVANEEKLQCSKIVETAR